MWPGSVLVHQHAHDHATTQRRAFRVDLGGERHARSLPHASPDHDNVVDVITSTAFGGKMAQSKPRKRRPHGEVKNAMRDFLAAKGEPASISEIKAGIEEKVGTAPDSSYRSALQDERVFERVSRGVFKLRD